jgi:hypothetical protein
VLLLQPCAVKPKAATAIIRNIIRLFMYVMLLS